MMRLFRDRPTVRSKVFASFLGMIILVVCLGILFQSGRGITTLRNDRSELVSVLEGFGRSTVPHDVAIAEAQQFLETTIIARFGQTDKDARALLGAALTLATAPSVIDASGRSNLLTDQLWELYSWYEPFIDRRATAHNMLIVLFSVTLAVMLILATAVQIRLRSIARDRRRLHGLARNQINLIELEQRSVMLELHDSVGQHLAVAQMLLSSIESEIAGDERAERALSECARAITEGREQIRRIARRLHPAELDQIGLASAITQLVEDYRGACSAEIALELSDTVDRLVSRDARIQVYRIVQEALTNAVTHSRASRIAVRLDDVADTVWAVVTDDGAGFQYRQESQSGFGILSMTERADIIDGTLAVLSRPGEGTMISLQISS